MSIFHRIIARPRPLWVGISVSLLLILAPFGVITLDGVWEPVLSGGNLRLLLLSPVVIIYILAVAQLMAKNDLNFLRAFRPLMLVDDENFDNLVRDASHINPVGEGLAMGIGALFGLGLGLSWLQGTITWGLRLYIPVSLILMHGLLGWTIYISIASTRLMTVLHQQPLQIDILDTKPFEPVGRYCLLTSLVFVGGITLGAIFGLDVRNILAWQTWVLYLPLLAVPVIMFFLNMRGTHRLLASEKNRQLQAVTQKIRLVSLGLQSKIAQEEPLGDTAIEFTALVTFETRLRAASTWPYNTGMLRTLFFTLLLPLLVRALSALLF